MVLQPGSPLFLRGTPTHHEGSASDLAQRGSEGPSRRLSSLRCPKRQRKQQEEVSHTQVKYEGIGHTPSLPALCKDPQQDAVAHQADDEGHRVQQRDKRLLKAQSLFQLACCSSVTAILIRVVVKRVVGPVSKVI